MLAKLKKIIHRFAKTGIENTHHTERQGVDTKRTFWQKVAFLLTLHGRVLWHFTKTKIVPLFTYKVVGAMFIVLVWAIIAFKTIPFAINYSIVYLLIGYTRGMTLVTSVSELEGFGQFAVKTVPKVFLREAETQDIVNQSGALLHVYGTELFLVVTILAVIVWLLFTRVKRDDSVRHALNMFIFIIILAYLLLHFNPVTMGTTVYFYKSWFIVNRSITFMKCVLLISAIGLMSVIRVQYRIFSIWIPVFFMLTLTTLLIMMCVQHFFLLALLLEVIAFLTVILLALRLDAEPIKTKMAFIYLVINSVLSIPMWVGVSWLYNFSNNLTFSSVRFCFSQLELANSQPSVFSQTGLLLVFVTFVFKLAAAPLAFWIADVYENATLVVAAFIMCVIKLCVFFAFLRVFLYFHSCVPPILISTLFGIVILASFLFSLVAIKETNIKRVLAVTSVSQVSYVFLGLLVPTPESVSAVLSFFIVYVFTTILFFIILALVSPTVQVLWGANFFLIGQTNIFYKTVLIICLLSFAGIPPFAGFFAKFVLLMKVYAQGTSVLIITLIFFALINSAVLLYVYLQLVINILRFNKSTVLLTLKTTVVSRKLTGIFQYWNNNYFVLVYVGFVLFGIVAYEYLSKTTYITITAEDVADLLLHPSRDWLHSGLIPKKILAEQLEIVEWLCTHDKLNQLHHARMNGQTTVILETIKEAQKDLTDSHK